MTEQRPIPAFAHKGGIAKTTTTVNLAASLAQARSETLMIDIDGILTFVGCPAHGTADERGPFLGGVLSVPPCATGVYSNAEYGAWGAGAGGFLYTESCALLVANWAAQEMAKEGEDADEYTVLRICPDHPEESADGCEYCTSDDYEEED